MELLFNLLESGDERLEKRGLQDLCELLERSRKLSSFQKDRLLRILSKFQKSNDILVRRWLYKTIGLLKDRSFLPFLRGQLNEHEGDKENITWIVAALYHITDHNEASIIIKNSNKLSPSTLLSAGYFEEKFLPNEIKVISKLIDKNDPLTLKWFCLLYGNSLNSFQIDPEKLKDNLTKLNLHDDPGVSEYSIWALHKSPLGLFSDSEISPQDFNDYPPNTRRWLYRLVTKEINSIQSNFDLIKSSIKGENDPYAREGLAIGIGKFSDSQQIIPIISDWLETEKNSLVHIQLLKSVSKKFSQIKEYQEIIRQEYENPKDQISKLIITDAYKLIEPAFKKAPETGSNISCKKVLLVVATPLELDIVITRFKTFNSIEPYLKEDMTFVNLGRIKNCEIHLVKSGMGSSQSDGSTLTVSDSIHLINPDYIIMPGIAFGLKEENQKLTQILVSKQLQGYELIKNTKTKNISRSDKIPAPDKLLKKFEISFALWKGEKVHFGLILSGEKLLNNKERREELKKDYPEAIGGDMEGQGVQAASYRNKKDWIIVKAICDWGYDKNDIHQQRAAENAVDFVIYTLKNIPF